LHDRSIKKIVRIALQKLKGALNCYEDNAQSREAERKAQAEFDQCLEPIIDHSDEYDRDEWRF